jgi:hypothetical protein
MLCKEEYALIVYDRMLGIVRLQRYGLRTTRAKATAVYGYAGMFTACMLFILQRSQSRSEIQTQRRTTSTTTSPACTPTLSVLTSGNNVTLLYSIYVHHVKK